MTTISPAIARTVLGYYNLPGGWAVRDFDRALLNAFMQSDSTNRQRFAIGFPELAAALSMELQELKDIADSTTN